MVEDLIIRNKTLGELLVFGRKGLTISKSFHKTCSLRKKLFYREQRMVAKMNAVSVATYEIIFTHFFVMVSRKMFGSENSHDNVFLRGI